jgi:hypothetical protein
MELFSIIVKVPSGWDWHLRGENKPDTTIVYSEVKNITPNVSLLLRIPKRLNPDRDFIFDNKMDNVHANQRIKGENILK